MVLIYIRVRQLSRAFEVMLLIRPMPIYVAAWGSDPLFPFLAPSYAASGSLGSYLRMNEWINTRI